MTCIAHCLYDHDYVLPCDLECNHVLNDQVEMQNQYHGQQEMLEVGLVLRKIIATNYFASFPVEDLANADQNKSSQICEIVE